MFCYYALSGLNYKNSKITTCPRQSDSLSEFSKSILPSEVYNNENFINVRKLLSNDVWPQGCDTCQKMEENNLKSMRNDFKIIDGLFFNDRQELCQLSEFDNQSILSCLDENYLMDNNGLRTIEFRFSNSCNFSCLHCSDVFSSKWSRLVNSLEYNEFDHLLEITQLTGKEHRKNDNDNLKIEMTYDQIDSIIDDLCKNFKKLERIDFSGGELLYQKKFWYALEKLRKHPNAHKIYISFHTNFNVDFDVEYLNELLKSYYASSIVISIDGGKNIYEYFRKGGDWNKLLKNIKKFKKINFNTKKYITCTTSIFQILDIENIFESFLDIDLRMESSIVQSPLYLDPSLIMHEYGKEIMSDFDSTERMILNHKNKKMKNNFLFNLKNIKNYLCNNKMNHRYFNKFLYYRDRMDHILDQNFNDYFSKFYFHDKELFRK